MTFDCWPVETILKASAVWGQEEASKIFVASTCSTGGVVLEEVDFMLIFPIRIVDLSMKL